MMKLSRRQADTLLTKLRLSEQVIDEITFVRTSSDVIVRTSSDETSLSEQAEDDYRSKK